MNRVARWEIAKHMAIELYPLDLEKQREYVKQRLNRRVVKQARELVFVGSSGNLVEPMAPLNPLLAREPLGSNQGGAQ